MRVSVPGMALFKALLMIFGLTTLYAQIPQQCQTGQYTEKNGETSRALSYELAADDEAGPICDVTIQKGWYRFRSSPTVSHDDIPFTTPQGSFFCGFQFPMYLEGQDVSIYPQPGQTVQMNVCTYVNPTLPCFKDPANPITVQITNCGGFNIYELEASMNCGVGYCFEPMKNPEPTTTTKPTAQSGCKVKTADVAIILDASSSINATEWIQEINFAKAIVNNFEIGPDAVRLALIQYSTVARLEFNLTQYATKQDILTAMTNVVKLRGITATHLALSMARTQVFQPASDERDGVSKIAFVITDGESTRTDQTILQANLLKQSNVTVFAVGVGSAAQTELEAIASDNSNVYSFTDFNQLEALQENFSERTCESVVNEVENCKRILQKFIMDFTANWVP